jgi:SagB-type dehydrogenase family enzyme
MRERDSMGTLICHSAVRLFPPEKSGRWRAINLYTKITYGCSSLAAMLLVAFIGGANRQEVVLLFLKKYCFDEATTDASISALMQLKLLIQPDDESHQRCSRLCREWSRYGWVDTADYQLATLDYPFADYAEDGREIDFQRMQEYVYDEPDTQRTKTYPNPKNRISAQTTVCALEKLSDTFSSVWTGDPPLQRFTKERCLTLMSSVFGVLKRKQLSDSPELISAAINKTSPSGGSRHPTEAYLFACNIQGLSSGVYHFNIDNSSLDAISDLDTSEPALMSMFSGPMRASFRIDGFVVMTSIFDRSMWRYREPRSFRAIYMDVGHLCATLDIVAKSLGLNCLVQHGLSEQPIANLLGTNTLTEGVIYGAALGGSHERHI